MRGGRRAGKRRRCGAVLRPLKTNAVQLAILPLLSALKMDVKAVGAA